jgi:formylglycine-generating enzyme required for sulfatase activity
MKFISVFFLIGSFAIGSFAADVSPAGMVKIPAGKFTPFTAKAKKGKTQPAEVTVKEFFLDQTPVTNEDFLKFVKNHPEWQKENIKRVFADAHYLQAWTGDLQFPTMMAKKPVTDVSWFAASAYCDSLGKRLPTTNEWEYALWDQGRKQKEVKAKILRWYSQPNDKKLPEVGHGEKNERGISDLGFVIWEWTEDFNSFLVSSDARAEEGPGKSGFFCGSGSQLGDPSDYASFMRYSFRASLKANYTTSNLGFRCAKEVTP